MASSLRILHLEDDPNDADLVHATLTDNELACTITRVDTAETFKAALERDRFELILSDYNLPTLNGLDALKLAAAIRPALPFIFVSGVMGEEFAVLTLHLGATDYVLKKNLSRLPAAVRRALNEAEATATRVRMEESLRLHATRMKSLMDCSLDAIIVMDSQGVILDWNVQAVTVFGWQKSEVVGRLVAEVIIPPQHREAHTRGLKRFLTTGEGPVINRRIEITALHRNGREFPVELAVTAAMIHDQWQFTAFIIDASHRKRAERRLATQYAVTEVLGEAATLEKVGAKILQVLCECLGWEVGSLWRVDHAANVLRCIQSWHVPKLDAAEFMADTRQQTFAPGVGMPGRVWSLGEPTWIPDVLRDPNFPRAPLAAKAGLHGAVGFPIKIGKQVYGIIECFSREIREPDTDLMQVTGEIGIKLGQFLERKEVEEALRRSEERFKIMIDQAPMGIAMIDSLTGHIYTVNTRFAQIAGRSVEEMSRINWMSITHPDDVQKDLDNMALLNAGTIPGFQMEKRYLLPNGNAIWINMTIAPVKGEDGSRRRHLCMIEDITERKQGVDASRRLAAIVESSHDSIMSLTLTGIVTSWNKGAADIFGYSSEEMLGKPITILLPPDRIDEEEQIIGRLKQGERVEHYETVRQRKDGTLIYVSLTASPIVDEHGTLIGLSKIVRDITERKYFEEVRLAKGSAEQANQAKSEFLSRMSHELRTPLNAVLGFAQLLEMEDLNPDQLEHVRQILKGGHHLLTLVNEVLDIARIEAGRLSFSLEPVAVSVVVVEAADLIRPQAAARKIKLTLPPAADTPIYVRADQQRLKQVLVNLLSNGVKYNREGGTLTVTGQGTPEGRYQLTVTDTGGGIPAAMMSRLFTPFDRLEADSRTEGTGLGLALSRSLVTAMGGTIFVDSVVGQGTSVQVEIPMAEPPATSPAIVDDIVRVPALVSGRTATVLYIEDNQSNYQLVERLIERRPGIRLIGAAQGNMGLELAVAHSPDLILLDLNLPDMQGNEILLRLRERPETAMIPIVMLSADAMPTQVDRLLSAGAQKYLTKPIDVMEFYAVLDEFITNKGGH